jgi:hypothetical protein
MGRGETLKKKWGCVVQSLMGLFERKKRSKSFNDGVYLIISSFKMLYRQILKLSSTNNLSKVPDDDEFASLLELAYAKMKRIQPSGLFFTLLEWVETYLVCLVDDASELDTYETLYNKILNDFAEKANQTLNLLSKMEDADETTDDSMAEKGLEVKLISEINNLENLLVLKRSDEKECCIMRKGDSLVARLNQISSDLDAADNPISDLFWRAYHDFLQSEKITFYNLF